METIKENTNNTENIGREISLSEIFSMLLAKWYIMLAAAVVAGVAAFIFFNFFVTPKYTSNASIMVINRQNTDSITATDLTASTTLSNDYVEIITSRSVLEQVIADLNLDYDVDELKDMISASVVVNTRKINISVTNKDPILAKKIADSVVTASSARICEIMNVDNMVSTVDDGNLPEVPSSPATIRNTIIAILSGIVIAAIIIIVVGFFDDRIKTREDVEKYLGVSVIGVIPVFETDKGKNNQKQQTKSNEGGTK